jgi:hypothetical protein
MADNLDIIATTTGNGDFCTVQLLRCWVEDSITGGNRAYRGLARIRGDIPMVFRVIGGFVHMMSQFLESFSL